MPSPTSGIIAVPVTPHRRPVENGFDASSQPACSFVLDGPDGLEDLRDVGEGDVVHQQLADYRKGVGLKGIVPLCLVFGIAPFGGLGGYQQISRSLESDDRGFSGSEGAAGCFALDNGVASFVNRLPGKPGLLPGQRQGYTGKTAKPHFATFPADEAAQDPCPSSAGYDLKIQASDAADCVHAGAPNALQFESRQLPRDLRHKSPPYSAPANLPANIIVIGRHDKRQSEADEIEINAYKTVACET